VGACGGTAASFVAAQKGRKGSESNERRNSLRTDALRHSCNEGESPYDSSSPLNLSSFPYIEYTLTKAALGFRFHLGQQREVGYRCPGDSRLLRESVITQTSTVDDGCKGGGVL